MFNSIHLFHFIRPYWFLAIIPMAIMLWTLRKHLTAGDNWQKVIDKHLLPHLLLSNSKSRNYWPLYLISLIWFIAIFSMAGPTWSKKPQPVYRSQVAKLILLDLSPSMLAQDLKPSRIARARYKIMDILKGYPEGQTGMAVFSSEAYTVSPLTNDTRTIAAMVPVLSPKIMPAIGINMGTGLKKAEKLLQQANAKTGTIILITDSIPSAATFAEARKIHRAGYKISVLAVGTKAGAPIPNANGGFITQQGKTYIAKLNIKALEKLARVGGGRFSSFSNSDKDITYLMQPSLAEHSLAKAKKTDANTDLWKDQGRWFLLLLLPLMLLLFRRGWLEEVCR